jgi:NAD dependent epimerase/dehydratase family enzyme
MPVPGIALRLLYGELADTLLTGQRVLPQVAQSLGYRFAWPTLGPALDDLLRR